jgi:hypothetical protein
VVDENFFVFVICEIALLSIPEMCPDVIGDVASLYVDYLFHGWLQRMPTYSESVWIGRDSTDGIASSSRSVAYMHEAVRTGRAETCAPARLPADPVRLDPSLS